MVATFRTGTDWQVSPQPFTIVMVHESDLWPINDNSISGTKDDLDDGDHPVVAVGNRAGVNRGLQFSGVVLKLTAGLTVPLGIVELIIEDGYAVRQYINNTLTYAEGVPATFQTTPYPGHPVYIDDSAALSDGCTLSLSPLNSAGLYNPVGGYLMYDQDEMADSAVGGARAASTFDTVLADEEVEQEYAILLIMGGMNPG